MSTIRPLTYWCLAIGAPNCCRPLRARWSAERPPDRADEKGREQDAFLDDRMPEDLRAGIDPPDQRLAADMDVPERHRAERRAGALHLRCRRGDARRGARPGRR